MTDRPVPISLGKPSLRRRLEDYYSLIAPDQISNPQEWLTKYSIIYEKFGGSYEGERKLATKLANKYGTTVRLLLAESALTAAPQAVAESSNGTKRDEEWYTAKPTRSGDVCFTSPTLDCMALLFGPDDASIERANPHIATSARLDNVSKFPHYLPDCDPLHRPHEVRRNKRPTEHPTARPVANNALTAIAEPHATGPLAVLYTCLRQRKRLRVVIRHRHGNRGTLTGYVLGFDAHWNLWLKDVIEVTMENMVPHQRHLSQLLVRGDNVILAYPSEGERSAVPKTSTSPKQSLYFPRTTKLASVGTPGSWLYAKATKGSSGKSTSGW
jgi:small nuclear ribonucleoprotein (snRNP)-like protein